MSFFHSSAFPYTVSCPVSVYVLLSEKWEELSEVISLVKILPFVTVPSVIRTLSTNIANYSFICLPNIYEVSLCSSHGARMVSKLYKELLRACDRGGNPTRKSGCAV